MTENLPEVRTTSQAPAQPDMRDRRTDSWTDVLMPTVNLAGNIAATEFVPTGLRGSTEKVTAAILYSRELGLPPMTGLGSVHVINGKAGISAETMRALVQQAGHQIRTTEMTESRCVMKGRRRDEEDWVTASYTMNEADRAGDSKKNPNYRTRPAEMLLARCTTRLCRMAFADVIHGMASTEELDDLAAEDGDTPAIEPVDSNQTAVKRAPKKRATRKKAEPEPQGPAPERQHAPLPAPRGGGHGYQDGPEQQPMVGEPSQEERPANVDSDGVVDADIVVDDTPKPAARHDVQQIQMHLKRLEVTDRAERLWWAGELSGRGEIASTTDLTAQEADRVIKELARVRDNASLVARGKELGLDV
jgi:hypothetical protein